MALGNRYETSNFRSNVFQPKCGVLKTLKRSVSPFCSKLTELPPAQRLKRAGTAGGRRRVGSSTLPRCRLEESARISTAAAAQNLPSPRRGRPCSSSPSPGSQPAMRAPAPGLETQEESSVNEVLWGEGERTETRPNLVCYPAKDQRLPCSPSPRSSYQRDRSRLRRWPCSPSAPRAPTGAPEEPAPSPRSRGAPGGCPFAPRSSHRPCVRRGCQSPKRSAMPPSPARREGGMGGGVRRPRFSPRGLRACFACASPATDGCSGAGCIIISY